MGDAFIVACARGAAEEVQQFLTDGVDPDTVHSTVGASALIAAVDRGRATCVELLLGAGADVDKPVTKAVNLGDNQELGLDTPLLMAIKKSHTACVELLLGARADVGKRAGGNNMDYTPLGYAALGNKTDMVRLLLAKGATNDNTNSGGRHTPLALAAAMGHTGCVEQLLAARADVDQCMYGDSKNTPLHGAAKENQADCAQLLLEAGATVDARTSKGFTPLRWAAQKGNAECVALLLEHSANPHSVSNLGSNVIWGAASSGSFDVVRTLLQLGVDPSLRTNSDIDKQEADMSAHDIAKQKGYGAIVALLAAERLPEPPLIRTRLIAATQRLALAGLLSARLGHGAAVQPDMDLLTLIAGVRQPLVVECVFSGWPYSGHPSEGRFDRCGALHHIATQGGTTQWHHPAHKLVMVPDDAVPIPVEAVEPGCIIITPMHASFNDGDEILSIGPSIVQVTTISDGECSDVPTEKVLEEEGSEIRVYARDDVIITPPQISTTSSSGAWEMRTNEDAVEHTVLSHLVSDSMGNIWDELQLMHCRTKDKEGSWVALDLGEGRTIEVTGYTLRHGGHYTSQLRSWELQGSATAEGPWVTLDRRKCDRTLPTYPRSRGPYVDVGYWCANKAASGIAVRHVRIMQTGPNAAERHSLFCGGLELYGVLREAEA